MKINELRKISQLSRPDNRKEVPIAKLVRFFSIYLTWCSLKIGLSPNAITLISALLGVVSGIALVSYDGVFVLLIVGIFMFLSYVLDATDGEVARVTERCSLTGLAFDIFAQQFALAALLFGLCVKIQLDGFDLVSFIGLIGIFAFMQNSLLSNIIESTATKGDSRDYSENFVVCGCKEDIVSGGSFRGWDLTIMNHIRSFVQLPNQLALFEVSLFCDIFSEVLIFRDGLLFMRIYLVVFSITFTLLFIYKIFKYSKDFSADKIYRKLFVNKISDEINLKENSIQKKN